MNTDSPPPRGYTRRSFFGGLLSLGTAGVAAVLAIPVLRFVLYPLYAKSTPESWSEVGHASEFAEAKEPVRKTITLTQRDGWREIVSAQTVYVTRGAAGQLTVLSAICPHLGCNVSWQPGRGRFVCPCHGGQFQSDGQRLSGPPPRSLDTLRSQVRGGVLRVQFEYFRPNVSNREAMS